MNDETKDGQNEQDAPRIMTVSEAQDYLSQQRTAAREERMQQIRDGYIDHPRAIAGGSGSSRRNRGGAAPIKGSQQDQQMAPSHEGDGVAASGGASLGDLLETVLSPSPPPALYPYVVRGAKISCTFGTHFRKLDMPLTHGVFIGDKPMLNERDCRVGKNYNIAPFGICLSARNRQQQIDIHEADPEELRPIAKVGDAWVVPDLPLEGRKCVPVLGSKWANAHEDVLIGNRPALTKACTLSCIFGGYIEILTDGQEED